VLVVDDEPAVRAVAVDMFQSLGLRVIEAYNGDDALWMLYRHPEIAVLFTDVRMPGMSGVELAEHAQRIRPDLRIVLTSGYLGEAPARPDLTVPKSWRQKDLAQLLAGIPESPQRKRVRSDNLKGQTG
jgi:CheY-like chemotaxis protein